MSSISRKSFLKQTGLLGLAAATGGAGLFQNALAGNPPKPLSAIGIQLYTIIPLLENDFEGTLQTLSEIGYRELEFAGPYYFSAGESDRNGGFYGNTANETREMLERYGLKGPAAHIGLNTLRNNLSQVIDAAGTVGIEYVICPILDEGERQSLDDYKKLAAELNRIGENLSEAGLQLGYHNHSFEFGEMDGEIPYNILLESTDPDLVVMELDLFWITSAGYDPVDYFKSYPGRFHAVHVKDMKKKMVLDDPMAMRQAFSNLEDAGKGAIDFERIFSHHEQAGIRHYFVERDFPPNPMETVKNAYGYLSQLKMG